MEIVAIADTHGMHRDMVHAIPSCDVLVHAGDLCKYGDINEVIDFAMWIETQPAEHIIVIAGNHDGPFQKDRHQAELELKVSDRIHYLRDESIVIDGVKFYGSPWQPAFCDWYFNLPRNGDALEACWAQIPDDTDVLVTHGPSYGILDDNIRSISCGCEKLRLRVEQVRPKSHVFGHIHDSYGLYEWEGIKFINASVANEDYNLLNEPIVFAV